MCLGSHISQYHMSVQDVEQRVYHMSVQEVEQRLVCYEQGKEVQQAPTSDPGGPPAGLVLDWYTHILVRSAVEAMADLVVPTLIIFRRESVLCVWWRLTCLDSLRQSQHWPGRHRLMRYGVRVQDKRARAPARGRGGHGGSTCR
jgi:hypothetical protein